MGIVRRSLRRVIHGFVVDHCAREVLDRGGLDFDLCIVHNDHRRERSTPSLMKRFWQGASFRLDTQNGPITKRWTQIAFAAALSVLFICRDWVIATVIPLNQSMLMNKRLQQIKVASNKLAASIEDCLAALQQTVKQDDSIYVFALVISDDFSDMVGYANTKSHLVGSGGTELDKWYFGEWQEQGLSVGFDSVLETLGDVEDVDESPENGNAVDWLATMSTAIKQVLEVSTSNKMPLLLASMTDSMNATWLEPHSAEYANGASAYRPVSLEHQAAIKEWFYEYDPDVTVNPNLFESYKRLLIEANVE